MPMSHKELKFSTKRVAQFCSMFSATEESAQEILAKASWAIAPLDQISRQMDEDTEIKETSFVATNEVHVTVTDLNSGEKLKFLLTREAAEAVTCFHEENEGRTVFSWDLKRVADAVVSESAKFKRMRNTPRGLNL